jgi:hypothetical protein
MTSPDPETFSVDTDSGGLDGAASAMDELRGALVSIGRELERDLAASNMLPSSPDPAWKNNKDFAAQYVGNATGAIAGITGGAKNVAEVVGGLSVLKDGLNSTEEANTEAAGRE